MGAVIPDGGVTPESAVVPSPIFPTVDARLVKLGGVRDTVFPLAFVTVTDDGENVPVELKTEA